jgi:hypothetical protein
VEIAVERISIVGVAIVCAIVTASAQTISAPSEYRNDSYEYAVTLPPGVKILASEPPAPDHGFGIKLTSTTQLWVDGSYVEAAHNLRETIEEEKRIEKLGHCRLLRTRAASLGGEAAVERVLRCKDESTDNKSVIDTRVITYRANVDYSVSIRRPAGERLSPDAERLFRAVIEGFRFAPRPR